MKDAISELGELAKLLQFEKKEDFLQFESALNNAPIKKRKADGITWYPLKITGRGFGMGSYPYLIVDRNPGESQIHKFNTSSPVSFFSTNDEEESLNGVVDYVEDHKMKITFYKDELPDWIENDKIGVNLMFDSRTYLEMERALNILINADGGRVKELRDILLGYKNTSRSNQGNVNIPTLNVSQNAAVNLVLQSDDVAIIHGPPGTGKTTTLVAAINELVNAGKKVLVCAPSNAAVNFLTLKLAQQSLKVVRVGNLSKIDFNLFPLTLEKIIQGEQEYKSIKEDKRRALDFRKMAQKYKRSFGPSEREQRKMLYREARDLIKNARETENYLIDKVIDQAQVVATTLIGSTHYSIRDRNFDVVVIDEAGQGLEPACWVPILKGERVIMAGDPLQLPPTVKSHDALRKGLSKTLIEKGIKRLDQTVLLDTQYRMNELIMSFSNDWFYEGKLKAASSVAKHNINDDHAEVEFIDTAGCGFEEKTGEYSLSKFNPEEGAIVLKRLEDIKSEDVSIAIISPYKEQVLWLKSSVKSIDNITINTIDSFQGQERDVVIISLVRNNDSGTIGFLKDYRRMNVAMTRAKKKLIVIGDSATIGQDKFYVKFLNFCENQGSYRSAWEYLY